MQPRDPFASYRTGPVGWVAVRPRPLDRPRVRRALAATCIGLGLLLGFLTGWMAAAPVEPPPPPSLEPEPAAPPRVEPVPAAAGPPR